MKHGHKMPSGEQAVQLTFEIPRTLRLRNMKECPKPQMFGAMGASAKFGQHKATFGRYQQQFNPGQNWWTVVHIGRHQTKVGRFQATIGRIRIVFAEIGKHSGRNRPNLAASGPNVPEIALIWSKSRGLGRTRSMFGLTRAKFGRIEQDEGDVLSQCGPTQLNSARSQVTQLRALRLYSTQRNRKSHN